MSQATNLTSGVPQGSPFSVSDVAALLRALVTLHSGASRPVVVDAEGQGSWLKVVSATQWELYYHDGTNDVLLGTLDPTNHTWTMNGRLILQSASAPASALEHLARSGGIARISTCASRRTPGNGPLCRRGDSLL